MNAVLMASERETQRLQDQVDEARDQSLKELSVLRTELQNTQTELEKHERAAQECQKEVLEEFTHTHTHACTHTRASTSSGVVGQ